MSFTVCEFKDECKHEVSEKSFFDLCMGHSLCRDGETPYRTKICAWYIDYKEPPDRKLPKDRYKELVKK